MHRNLLIRSFGGSAQTKMPRGAQKRFCPFLLSRHVYTLYTAPRSGLALYRPELRLNLPVTSPRVTL